MLKPDFPAILRERRIPKIWDEFYHYTTAYDDFTTNATSVGGESVAVSATLLGGQLVLTTGGTASNEAGIYSTVKGFKVANDQPLYFETALQYTDGNSHDCGFFFGFSDVLNATGASGPLTAAAAAFKSSFTGFGFGKFKGDTNWRVISSATTTQLTNTTTTVCDDGASSPLHRFSITVDVINTTQCRATFAIDGVQCLDNTSGMSIAHLLTFNTTAFYTGLLAKAGGANSQTPGFDYLLALQDLRKSLA